MSFSLTRKTDYAIIALSHLAQESDGNGDPVSARLIAERYDLPLPLLMNALKELHRAGIIDSRRGAGGGYYLAREPRKILFHDVIEALEGPIHITLCSEEHDEDDCGACKIVTLCPISEPMQRFNNLLVDFLKKLTLKDIIQGETVFSPPALGVPV